MAEATVDLPKVGAVKKKWVWVAVAAVGGYVGWRWWQANSAGGEGGVEYTTDYVGDALPTGGAGGAVSGNVQYAGTVVDGTSAEVIDNNSEWTQKAVELLSNAGYDPALVYAALGDYLAKRPLTAEEQTIVRAALAAAGNPPIGGPYTITEQTGPTTTAAPKNLRVAAKTKSSVTLDWDPVPGADGYRVYRGSGENIGHSFDSKFTVTGLAAGKSYTFTVAALSSLGKTGPRSNAVTVSTSNVELKAPTGLKVTKTGKTSVELRWSPVTGADGYRLYRSGASGNVGASGDGVGTIYGLKPGTRYRFHVKALDHQGRIGPSSASVSAATKRK